MAQRRHSTKLSLQSSELGLPHPLTRRQVWTLPFGSGGKHTRLRERGWGVLSSNEGTDTVVLVNIYAPCGKWERRRQKEDKAKNGNKGKRGKVGAKIEKVEERGRRVIIREGRRKDREWRGKEWGDGKRGMGRGRKVGNRKCIERKMKRKECKRNSRM